LKDLLLAACHLFYAEQSRYHFHSVYVSVCVSGKNWKSADQKLMSLDASMCGGEP